MKITECQTLHSVLQQNRLSASEKQFIRASSCGMAPDNRPFVCCTGDTGYTRSRRVTPAFSDYGDYDYGWNPAQQTTSTRTMLYPSQDFRPWSFGNERVNNRNPQSQGQVFQPQQSSDGASLLPQPPTCGAVSIDNKIYGGEDTDLYEFPWLVLFEYQRLSGNGLATSCAGSLINQRYVLTAAHCLTGRITREIGTL